jgi:hypothetical protein
MEIKMIDGRVYDRIRQCLKELLEKTQKLQPTFDSDFRQSKKVTDW